MELLKYIKKIFRLKYTEINPITRVGVNFKIGKDFRILNQHYIEIGDNFFALDRLRIEAWDNYRGVIFEPKVKIGDNVIFNSDIHIGCVNGVYIGNNCLFGSRIYITDHDHGTTDVLDLTISPAERRLFSKGEVRIGENVYLGEGVVVLPGVNIGRNAVIGANSVVTKDIPDFGVYAGIPAKSLKLVN